MRAQAGLGFLAWAAVQASAAELPVSKDASLIQSSLCCGMTADRNFGTSPTVDAGRYHHHARALLGFSLADVPEASKALLVVPGSIVGSMPAVFTLSLVREDWNEYAVTYNQAPAAQKIAEALFADGALRFDVTDLVQAARGDGLISFVIDASGTANLFVPSRENTAGLKPAYLEWD